MTGEETFTTKAEGNTQQKNKLADLQRQLLAAQVERLVLSARIKAAERELQDKGVVAGEPIPAAEPQRSGSSRSDD